MFKVWEDIWYAADFTEDPECVSVDVKVYQIETLDETDGNHGYVAGIGNTTDLTKAQIMIEGFVKWDHCSNFKFIGGNYPFHFCSKQQAENIGVLLSRIYDEAISLLKDSWDQV